MLFVLLVLFAQAGCSNSLENSPKDGYSPTQERIVGFHIDMNIKQFRGEYLKSWLAELSSLGYNTIIWEVENNIQWETCPESVSPDAFSKAEFKELLSYSRELGLEPIPLLQTIGHCEYVLKHDEYLYLAEREGSITQYCPRNPDVTVFLKKWIAEYLEVFGDVKRFHLGADEARLLGHCEQCKAYVQEHSISELYIDHINTVSEPLIARQIQPIIWADMVLHYPEAIDKLSRKIMLFDWMYDIYRGNGKVRVWGKGYRRKGRFSAETLDRFGEYLYPYGNEPGRDPETFYSADYLAAKGFDTVTCPGSSSANDSVFAPKHYYHLRNTFDSFNKGLETHLKGAVLTSWTVHLFPWELQKTSIQAPNFIIKNPKASLDDYEKYFVETNFGIDDRVFFKASGFLSKGCLFSITRILGYNKSARPTKPRHVKRYLEKFAGKDKLEAGLKKTRQLLADYKLAVKLFDDYSSKAVRGHNILKYWKIAARNLVNRAETSICLLENKAGLEVKNAAEVLHRMRELKKETAAVYEISNKPTRRAQIIAWMYEPYEQALEQIVKNGKGEL